MGYFSDHSKKKIVVLLGHPNSDPTLSGELANVYVAAAKAAGHEVQFFKLGDLHFDPILHKGYKTIQALEPDLVTLQQAITACDHFVLVYPTWWATMPALLKGMFDRMWLPGFAFGFYKEGIKSHLHFWKRMMKPKTARVFVLSGTQPLVFRILFGDYTNEIKRGILGFAGFKTKVSRLGPTDHNPPEWLKQMWLRKAQKLGQLAE